MKILFIGNSHTYMNGLSYQVREMINASVGRADCEAWMLTAGGKSLGWHASEPGTQLNIVCNPWDYIALQQQTHPFAGYDQLAADCEKLRPYLMKTGSKVLLYLTWKHKEAPESDQEDLTSAFGRLSRELGWPAVPVGPAWRRARQLRPEIDLYAADGAHASQAGTYLAACVFYGIITGMPPKRLPARIVTHGTVLADLPPELAVALQRVAAEELAAEVRWAVP